VPELSPSTTELLIYVPTFNRSEKLRQQLDILVPQVNSCPNVELLVSDNASSDGTGEMLAGLLQGNSQVHVRSLKSNVGGNANALLGFACDLPARYIWILSDDDLVEVNALGNILEALELNPDLLTVQFPGNTPDSGRFFIHESGIEPLQKKSWGLFSAVVYSREFVKQSIQTGFSFHDSSFPHLAILFDACWKSTSGVNIISIESSKVFMIQEQSQAKSKSDYSLALTGGASLYHLAKESEKGKLARSWAWSNSIGMAFFRRRHLRAYLASVSFIRTHGGLRGRLYLVFGEILCFIQKSAFGTRFQAMVRGRPRILRMLLKLRINFFDPEGYHLE